MSKVLVISDTHFGHTNILRIRPEFGNVDEMNEALVENWNSAVNKYDTVFHLGDVAWTKKAAAEFLPRLNGAKILIAGNHDVYSWVAPHFDKILGARQYSDFIMTHIPIHNTEFCAWKLNLHGHLHAGIIPNDPRYVCVSVEQINYKPIDLNKLTKSWIAMYEEELKSLWSAQPYMGHL